MERLGGFGNSKFWVNQIPVALAMVGIAITNLPFSFFGNWIPSPMYALMPIYYWCLVRPDLMTPGWAFLIGLVHDVVSGEPTGLWAASFVATYAVIDKQRDGFAGLSGIGAILGFATAALATCTIHYVIYCVYWWKLLPVTSSIKEFAITAILYIPVVMVLAYMHRRFVGPLRSEF